MKIVLVSNLTPTNSEFRNEVDQRLTTPSVDEQSRGVHVI